MSTRHFSGTALKSRVENIGLVAKSVNCLLSMMSRTRSLRNEAQDLLQDLAKCQATVHGGGFAQLVEGVVPLGLVEDFAVHVVDDAVPLPA